MVSPYGSLIPYLHETATTTVSVYSGNRARYTVSTASLSLIGCWPESMRPSLCLSLSLSPFRLNSCTPSLSYLPLKLCTRSYTYLHVPSRGFASSTLARNAWNAAYRLKLICFCCRTRRMDESVDSWRKWSAIVLWWYRSLIKIDWLDQIGIC